MAKNIEVEIKAYLKEPLDTMKFRLENIFKKPMKKFHKLDSYYKKDEFFFRIREEDECKQITFKNKSTFLKGEVNDEFSFSILDKDKVLNFFCEKLSCQFLYSKIKEGWSLQKGAVLIEIFHIPQLGNFIEVEEILLEKDRERINDTLLGLESFLYSLDISPDVIEKRPYRELLGF